MAVKVKNLHGHTPVPNGYKSWLDFWGQHNFVKADKCAAMDCSEKATLGGHVIKVGSLDGSHYIVPLCDGCNQREDEFYASGALVAVNAK